MVDKFVAQLDPATLPIQDNDYFLTSRDGVALKQGFFSEIKKYISSLMTQISPVSTTSNTVFTSLTDLQFPVVSGKIYKFDFYIRFQTAATTTGITLNLTSGAGAAGILTAIADGVQAADGTAALYVGAVTAFDDSVTTASVAAANTDTVARIQGVFVCTASGIVVPQFRSEVAGSACTVSAGSAGIVSSN